MRPPASFNRRAFGQLVGAGALAVAANPASSLAQSPPKKKIAFLGTVVFKHSHTQHFIDRLNEGYIWNGTWQQPRVEVAGTYIAQFPEGTDLGRERIERYKLKTFNSVAETLTLGGKELAVDGVVIIGEHGNYPKNEKGQVRYPRYEWFKEIVKVFEASGRSVPVFNDKHLSTEWNECQEMVADAKRRKFPFHSGSSLPVTVRMPDIDMPYGADLRESVCVAYGGIDSYDFHALETAQCMSERRRGGEVGMKSLHAMRDEKVWEFLAQPAQKRTRDLVVAALCRSHNLPVEGGYPTAKVDFQWARKALPTIIGYFITHVDGFRTSVFMTGIRDFNYAGAIGDEGKILSCQMYLPMPGHGSSTADFFNPLVRHLETMIIENRQPYPLERTLLTSGMVIAGVNSLHAGEKLIETPEMAIKYSVKDETYYWRG
ncbi:MAG: hypothetical protein IT423_12895 [Pirellulaceae bacterium]|nr:hypothetical protein [Pirellulaceae bacterium]